MSSSDQSSGAEVAGRLCWRGCADRDSRERSLISERPDGHGGPAPALASAGDPGRRALAPGSHLGATPGLGRHRARSGEQRYDRAATVETRRACSRPAPTALGAVSSSPRRLTRRTCCWREGGLPPPRFGEPCLRLSGVQRAPSTGDRRNRLARAPISARRGHRV
jgi:hypothetical protein